MTKKISRNLMLIVIALFYCTTLEAFSQSVEKQAPPAPKDTKKTFRLQIEVTTGSPPRKVVGANVSVLSEEDSERYMKDAMTNREGIVILDHVPQGKVRIQVRAMDHDTFCQIYTLTRDNLTIRISLKRSGDQNNPQ